MNKHCTLFLIILILVCMNGVVQANAIPRPNVLHIIIDDLRPALGCYGDPIAKTPAIDKLASKGVLFKRAYVQYPICGPSRASFLTGRRPQSSGYFAWEYPTGLPMIPNWFKSNQYFTAGFGKVFHHGHILGGDRLITALNPPGSWNVSDLCNTIDDPCGYGYLYSSELRKEHPYAAKHVLSRGSVKPKGMRGGWFWQEWAELDLSDEQTTDGLVVRRAVQAMKDSVKRKKPFYIAAGMRRPHQLLAAPKKYFDLFPIESIPELPEEDPAHLKNLPAMALNYDRSRAYQVYSPKGRRELWRAYYANISFVDAQVQVLLEAMDELGLWKNTIVMLHSDHGWHLGEHGGLGNKDTLFDESIRTPLIIAAPGIKGVNQTCSYPVELVDVFPTLTELCGLATPQNLDGVNLKPLLDAPGSTLERKGAVSVVLRRINGDRAKGFSGIHMKLNSKAKVNGRVLGRTLNTTRWSYTEWDQGRYGFELYDMKEDPRQQNNLAINPGYKKVMMGLAKALRECDSTANKEVTSK